jgi:hypothetical protein
LLGAWPAVDSSEGGNPLADHGPVRRRIADLVKTGLQILIGIRSASIPAAFDSAASDPIASLPDENNEGCDQANRNKHPVLAFET